MNSVKAAAPRLGLSEKAVYALCAQKKLRHARVGPRKGKIVISDEAIEEYLREQTVETKAASVPPTKPTAKPVTPLSRHLKL